MKALATATIALAVTGCGSRGIDPQAWTCENLKPHVIEMSQTRRPRVLEINQVLSENNLPGELIECTAMAEWAEGSGAISYGAHISDSGSVILEYRQQ
jgi:hypothetical protein